MIELLDMQSDKALGMVIRGKIEKPDMERVYDDVNAKLAKLASADKLSVYVEIDQFQGISLDALVLDIKEGLPKIGRVRKKAVVSSGKWLEVFTKIGDKLFPSIEAKHFAPEQKQEAKAWVLA